MSTGNGKSLFKRCFDPRKIWDGIFMHILKLLFGVHKALVPSFCFHCGSLISLRRIVPPMTQQILNIYCVYDIFTQPDERNSWVMGGTYAYKTFCDAYKNWFKFCQPYIFTGKYHAHAQHFVQVFVTRTINA